MSKLSERVVTGLTLARSLQQIIGSGRLPAFCREVKGSYTLTYLNLFLCLRDAYSPRELARLARRCIWNRIYNDFDAEVLRGLTYQTNNFEIIERALTQGRGALLATQHVGPYRWTFLELIRRGYKVQLVLDAAGSIKVYEQIKHYFALRNMEHLHERLQIINAEQPRSARQILRALKHNELVLIYLDGNTGVGGQDQANKHNVQVDFFGQRVSVRKGACHLAHLAQSPIIPLLASWQNRTAVIDALAPVIPQREVEIDEFCRTGMQELFAVSEKFIRARPEQFEEWLHLHRWLAKDAGKQKTRLNLDDLKLAYTRFEHELEGGTSHYRVDASKVIVLPVGAGELLVDGEHRRILNVRPVTREVVAALAHGITLERLAKKLRGRYSTQHVLEELVRLKGLNLLECPQAN